VAAAPDQGTGEDAAEKPEREPYFIKSVERVFAVIKAFDEDHPEMTLADIARITGLDRGAARRFLLTLVDLGYVAQNGRMFSLRPRILELGYAYLSSLSLPEIALPVMEDLVRRVGESCALSVLDDTDVVFVARVPTRRFLSVSINVGARFPAHTSSMGRVLLAGQPDDWLDRYLETVSPEHLTDKTVTDPQELRRTLMQVREQGWALLDQELAEGVRSLAVPLRDKSGKVVAALNVSSHAADVETVHQYLPDVLEAAAAIEEGLGRIR
jgi:beta-ketoadipate pathway transcriptional regulators, PcaR/PcaU/PobR family